MCYFQFRNRIYTPKTIRAAGQIISITDLKGAKSAMPNTAKIAAGINAQRVSTWLGSIPTRAKVTANPRKKITSLPPRRFSNPATAANVTNTPPGMIAHH